MAPAGVQGLLDSLLRPLAGLNIERLYTKYHTGIDIVLYAFLLIFICRLALSRMFPGDNGRKLGTVVGIVLAISLSAAERSLGFSIKSFGPIAAGLIIFTISLVLYNMMRHAGAGHAACGATALIVTYFTMRAVLPGFFLWAQNNEWANYLHSLVVLAVIVALWRAISALFSPRETSALRKAVKKISTGSDRVIDVSRQQDASEWNVVRNRLQKLTVRGKRESEKVISILSEIIDVVRQHGADTRIAAPVCRALNEVKKHEHLLFAELSAIKKTDAALIHFDLAQFKALRARYGKLTQEQKAECKRQFVEEREKLRVAATIQRQADAAQAYAAQFEKCINAACECLKVARADDAAQWIEKAIEEERQASQILDEIRELEKRLLHVLGEQIRQLERASRK